MKQGIYEQIITEVVQKELSSLGSEFVISKHPIEKEDAVRLLVNHLSELLQKALQIFKGENALFKQVQLVNKVIDILHNEIAIEKHRDAFEKDFVLAEGQLLQAIFLKAAIDFKELDKLLNDIIPSTRLSQSELFTGGNSSISLESELRKEILSANEINLLVSFIKFKGIIILEKELTEFVEKGGKLRVITTTYMGASDYKAIELLSKLPNTEVKISYNTGNERLHAKAYLFRRNTGFHTGYIGSSNFSRSALTDGLEWNLKVTSKEVNHIIDKFQKTFDSYWRSSDFEIFDHNNHRDKLINSLQSAKALRTIDNPTIFFDIKPYPFQLEILEKLKVQREVHKNYKNLVVAATGTGKTMISAFDYKNFKKQSKRSRILFIAHRKEILIQAQGVFRSILKDNNFGELWVDGYTPNSYEAVFASVQTINNKLDTINLPTDYFDFIIIDECHHLKANSYQGILSHFKPSILLGLTATPERMDGGNIQDDFNQRISAEIRLPEALNRKLLCPFQYFGVSDNIDLSSVRWEKGRYVPSELSKIYTANDQRVRDIVNALNKYTKDIHEVKALGFCVNIEHAQFMAQKMELLGLKAAVLTGQNDNQTRKSLQKQLKDGALNYLFVVDIFNEGIDIPEIDTVLFLRPTESLTIFLQQLGRGLRLSEDKDVLTVLDFVGNSRPEYRFDNKFRALVGKTNTSIKSEIERNFPYLPLGCSIILEKQAKEYILENIRKNTQNNKRQIIFKIKSFQNESSLKFNLRNFSEFYNIPLQTIYQRGGWSALCYEAGVLEVFDDNQYDTAIRAVKNKWLSIISYDYLSFIKKLIENKFKINSIELEDSNLERKLVMLYYDFFTVPKKAASIIDAFEDIGSNKMLLSELLEVIEILLDRIDFKEVDFRLEKEFALKVYARHTRDQILSAIGLNSFNRKYQSQEGVAENKKENIEALFVNLIKSTDHFSPTTMYDDYAISETLFHWQSQNDTDPSTKKGKSYINHKNNNKTILLFVREQKEDEFGNTMGYVFLGPVTLTEYNGSKPMNIIWKLKHSIPPFLWQKAAKLRAS